MAWFRCENDLCPRCGDAVECPGDSEAPECRGCTQRLAPANDPSPVDRPATEQLAGELFVAVRAHFLRSARTASTVYEALNALAALSATLITGTGGEARKWFLAALNQNLDAQIPRADDSRAVEAARAEVLLRGTWWAADEILRLRGELAEAKRELEIVGRSARVLAFPEKRR